MTAERDQSISLTADYIAMLGEAGVQIDQLTAERDRLQRKWARVESERDRLLAEVGALRSQLAESQANDRCAMGYLSDVRQIVGGDDFPEMVRKCEKLRKDAERNQARLEVTRALFPSAPSDDELDMAIDAAMAEKDGQ